jgi:hypothetical protein
MDAYNMYKFMISFLVNLAEASIETKFMPTPYAEIDGKTNKLT